MTEKNQGKKVVILNLMDVCDELNKLRSRVWCIAKDMAKEQAKEDERKRHE